MCSGPKTGARPTTLRAAAGAAGRPRRQAASRQALCPPTVLTANAKARRTVTDLRGRSSHPTRLRGAAILLLAATSAA